jgi:hypothetical protein
MFGIVEFNSIINQPNSAILSVGAIVEKPIVKMPNRSRKYHDVISCLRPPYHRATGHFTNIETIYRKPSYHACVIAGYHNTIPSC